MFDSNIVIINISIVVIYKDDAHGAEGQLGPRGAAAGNPPGVHVTYVIDFSCLSYVCVAVARVIHCGSLRSWRFPCCTSYRFSMFREEPSLLL